VAAAQKALGLNLLVVKKKARDASYANFLFKYLNRALADRGGVTGSIPRSGESCKNEVLGSVLFC